MSVKQPRFCHMCGKKLEGAYLIYEHGLVVCESCNTTVPRCARCGVPSRKLTLVRGTLICPTCQQKAPICACCHIPILDSYTLIGDSPLKYCESCVKTRPHCDICRAPLDEDGKAFPGQGATVYRCATCFRLAVSTPQLAERLYRETHLLLKQELMLDIPILPELHLVERTALIRLNQQTGTLTDSDIPVGPEHQHLLGFFQRINESRTIYIERLLPQPLFRAVAAHELAHAWQSFHAPTNQPLTIVEGFAEWVAYRTLLSLGQQREAARLTRRNDLYGEGLQYFIALEQRTGRQGVMPRAIA